MKTRRRWNIRGFKKLRRLLQRERHIKIELFVRLSFMRLFQIGDDVQTRRGVPSLAWYEWFLCKGMQRMKDLLLQARVVVITSNMKISRRGLTDCVKKLH